MKVVVLTALRYSTASHCLPVLAAHPDIDVCGVVFCEGYFTNRRKQLRRTLKKASKIGVLGAIVGRSMRSWYAGPAGEDLFVVADRLGIPVHRTPRTNAPQTIERLRESGADLGLSLGNGWISSRVFRTPRLGMLNIHGEILPRFKGAASVIWAIHDGVRETGFTIHRVEKGIDTGAILYQDRIPLDLRPTLQETVRANVAEISRRVPQALADVVARYEELLQTAKPQTGGQSYTTPTFRQFLTMRRQHRRMLQQSDPG